MKKHSRYLFIICLLFTALFTSCTSKIDLELKKDGSVNVSFEGGSIGSSIKKLLSSVTGTASSSFSFDTNQIAEALKQSGFSNVMVRSPSGTDLVITMKDINKKSILFSSGIINTDEKKLELTLNPQRLINFYYDCDETLKTYLDLLMAPVFNDEIMSEQEYLSTVSSLYGNDIGKEIGESVFLIKLKNPDGKTSERKITLAELLTLNNTLQLE